VTVLIATRTVTSGYVQGLGNAYRPTAIDWGDGSSDLVAQKWTG